MLAARIVGTRQELERERLDSAQLGPVVRSMHVSREGGSFFQTYIVSLYLGEDLIPLWSFKWLMPVLTWVVRKVVIANVVLIWLSLLLVLVTGYGIPGWCL